jgi:hypothetical protein
MPNCWRHIDLTTAGSYRWAEEQQKVIEKGGHTMTAQRQVCSADIPNAPGGGARTSRVEYRGLDSSVFRQQAAREAASLI